MKWLPRIVVLALIMSVATPVFADNARSAAARQKAALAQRQNQQRLALARNAATKRQATAMKKSVATTSPTRKPASSSPTSRASNQDIAASRFLFGALLLGLGSNGGGFDFNASNGQDDHQERFERQQRYNMQYWEDRARQETNAGNFSAAEQAMQNAK